MHRPYFAAGQSLMNVDTYVGRLDLFCKGARVGSWLTYDTKRKNETADLEK